MPEASKHCGQKGQKYLISNFSYEYWTIIFSEESYFRICRERSWVSREVDHVQALFGSYVPFKDPLVFS